LHRGARAERVADENHSLEVKGVDGAENAQRLCFVREARVALHHRVTEGRHVERDRAIARGSERMHRSAPDLAPCLGSVNQQNSRSVGGAFLLKKYPRRPRERSVPIAVQHPERVSARAPRQRFAASRRREPSPRTRSRASGRHDEGGGISLRSIRVEEPQLFHGAVYRVQYSLRPEVYWLHSAGCSIDGREAGES
jgi:hypothetical protein